MNPPSTQIACPSGRFHHRHVPTGLMRADGLLLAQDAVVLLNLLAGFSNCPLLLIY